MSGLDESVRAIVERNRKSRAEYDAISARVVSLTLNGTQEEIDNLGRELDERFRELLQGPGQDPAISGTDGSSAHASDGSGEPTQ